MRKLKQRIKDKLGDKRTTSIKKAFNIARVIKNVICWTLIAFLAVAIIIFMSTKISGGTPSVFGYTIHRIASGSMEPELSIGDVIFSSKVNAVSDIGVGDIITFQGDNRFNNRKVTHRVLVAPYEDANGKIVVVTKGDANENDDGAISFADVESKFIKKVNFLKDVYNFFFSTWGFLIFIFLLLLVFFDEIVNIIRLTIGSAQEEDTESFQEIFERVKREQMEKAKRNQDDEKYAQLEEQSTLSSSQGQEQDDAETSSAPVVDQSHVEKNEIKTKLQKKENPEKPSSETQPKQQNTSRPKPKSKKNNAGSKQDRTNKIKNQSSSKNKSKNKSKKRNKR